MNGAQVGVTDIHASVTISNGRFVADLDQWVALYDGILVFACPTYCSDSE
jgi:hypothetical protein